MLFKKKTLDEKMEKYVKHHDWYAIQEVLQEVKKKRLQQLRLLVQVMMQMMMLYSQHVSR